MVVILAFGLTVLAMPPAIALARRLQLLDRPGRLKVQREAVPWVGGLAIALGLIAGAIASRPAFLVPLAMALALGVWDDARGVAPKIRLGIAGLIGATVAAIIPTKIPSPVGVLAVVVVVMVLVNGVNMIDGLDGLAGGVALVSALGFAILLAGDGRPLASALVGALGGFLVFNRPPARVYMGDGGAYLVGTALALLLCEAWRPGTKLSLSLGCLLLSAYPVAELGCAAVRRLKARMPLFGGDRGHVYDQLVQRGWPPAQAVLACVAVQGVLAVVAIGAVGRAPALSAGLVVASFVALLAAAASFGFLAPSYRGDGA